MTRWEIYNGVRKELEKAAEYLEFRVQRRQQHGEIWSLKVDPLPGSEGGLDESLEGAIAWWARPSGHGTGTSDVLAVAADEQLLHLRFATSTPPGKGELIRVYPPLYLKGLADYWEDADLSETSLRWLESAIESNDFEECWAVPSNVVSFATLRTRQEEALSLPGWQMSFLWGPPGTGKTYTLGALIAGLLIHDPKARVLVFSTTNTAVDQALVSVDKALEQLACTTPAAASARRACFRVGTRYVASHYEGRGHLLPVGKHELIQELVRLEASRPDSSCVEALAEWKTEEESVRRRLKARMSAVLRKSRVAALTSTAAVFYMDDIRQTGPWSLVVFDEASQVSIAHGLAIAPLADRALFAGDSKQLAPIAQSGHPNAKDWLARSMFYYQQDRPCSSVMLDEQSRMSEPICRLVSNVFYRGELVVARNKMADPNWVISRLPPQVGGIGADALAIVEIASEGRFQPMQRSTARQESAQAVADLCTVLVENQQEQDILVVTPFRAQRTLVRSKLRAAGLRRVRVSTAHRAQGSERHTVLFDPVLGASGFLLKEVAPRLINVAISRAMARLVLFLSAGDRTNPLLGQLATVIENNNLKSTAVPAVNFVERPNFPSCLLHQVVQIGRTIGRVVALPDQGEKIEIVCFNTGRCTKFLTSKISEQARRAPPPLPAAADTQSMEEKEALVYGVLQRLGFELIDKRPKGGALWVVCGWESRQLMNAFNVFGIHFTFTENGSASSGYRPSWYYRRLA